MLILSVLAGWTLLSIPVGVVVGRALRRAGDPAPGWSAYDDQQLEQWAAHRDRLGA